MPKLSTQDVSDRLAIPVSTVKNWADKLGIGDKNSSGKWLFDDRDIATLELVRSLRSEDCGFDTIQRQISPSADNQRQAEPGDAERPLADQSAAMDLETLTAQVTAAVQATLKADNELAEKYAHAAHRIGTLEEQVRALQEREQRLLAAGEAKDTDVEALKARLAETEQARIRVEAERDTLQAQAARPWWRKLFS
jgi:DNA-binding transcriptional MerR regulator